MDIMLASASYCAERGESTRLSGLEGAALSGALGQKETSSQTKKGHTYWDLREEGVYHAGRDLSDDTANKESFTCH